jgi:hypothetical protein
MLSAPNEQSTDMGLNPSNSTLPVGRSVLLM